MKRFRNIALALVVISFFLVVAVCTFYNINMAKVSNDNTLKEVTIKAGSINSIANTLKENNLEIHHINTKSVSQSEKTNSKTNFSFQEEKSINPFNTYNVNSNRKKKLLFSAIFITSFILFFSCHKSYY